MTTKTLEQVNRRELAERLMSDGPWLTQGDIADLVGVSRKQVNEWNRKRKAKARRGE